ncbi:uncharacterized protein LOC141676548 [Apium graveolens]|uniref:uncharacterized protein LOC141676548 n=1 Tax=Apium graveolens TaxID=4045 RepID=UPI003D7A7D15
MEIARLNIITDFISPISRVPQFYASFWKWGALVFAIFATCTSLFARIKLYLVRLHSIKHSSSVSLHDHLQQLNNDSDFSDNDDDNNSLSARESVDDEFDSIFAYYDDQDVHAPYKGEQDYSVAGSYSYCDNQGQISYLEHQGNVNFDICGLFTTGKSVVKQWDYLGLGFQENLTSEPSIYDISKDENVGTFFDVTHQISPAIIYLTEMSNGSNGVKIGAYDRRIRAEKPVMYAEWGSSFGKVAGLSYGGVEVVYVKHGGACTVCDMRNLRSPLKVLSTALET